MRIQNVAARSQLTYVEGCAGIGMLGEGLRAGLDWLGVESRCVGYIERDGFAASALVARMEDASLDQAPIADTLESFDGRLWRGRVDCFAAGFPCQPWSHAGKQEGIGDERWLWPALVRIIVDVEPGLVFLENVPGLVSGGGLEYVLSDLAKMGFDAEWCHITAGAVGASHKRDRFFLLAYARCKRLRLWHDARDPRRAPSDSQGDHEGEERQRSGEPSGGGVATVRESVGYSIGARADEHAARRGPRDSTGEPGGFVGDNAGPRCAGGENSGANSDHAGQRCRSSESERGSAGVAAAERSRSQGDGPSEPQRRGEPVARDRGGRIFAFVPSDPRWPETIAESPHLAPAVEPGFCVLVDGLAVVVDEARADQLRCGGNGIVALQAAVAFVVLARRLGIWCQDEVVVVK